MRRFLTLIVYLLIIVAVLVFASWLLGQIGNSVFEKWGKIVLYIIAFIAAIYLVFKIVRREDVDL